MKLADLSNSPYLASDDYKVGTIMPPVVIERIEMNDVPIPNSTKKNRKAVAFFKGATKGWVMNKTVARNIARKTEADTSMIDKSFVGITVQFIVVGDVRRPDGTKGNAFRLHDAWAVGQTASKGPIQQEETKETTPGTEAAQ